MYPEDLKYIMEHMWIRIVGKEAIIGITHFAQESLGEIVFVDLPQLGDVFTAGDVICNVESAKSISEVFTPLAGKVIAVNEELIDSPTLVNSDPYAKGWMVKLEAEETNSENFITAAEYERYVNDLENK